MPNDDSVFHSAITDNELLMRAMLDAVEAVMRFCVVGHSIPDAIARLDLLRRHFEETRQHDLA
jgi:hypothetical protein